MRHPCAVLLLASLLCAGARAEPVSSAMLPVSAVGVTLDELPALERVDRALRAALAAESALTLQPESTSRAHLASARELGLSCASDATPCLGKLMILMEVDTLVVTTASPRAEGFDVTLAFVERDGSRREVRAALRATPPELDRDAHQLVEQLLAVSPKRGSPPAAVPASPPTSSEGPQTPPAPPTEVAAPAAPSSTTTTTAAAPPAALGDDDDGEVPWLWLGLGAGAAGVVAAGAGVALAVALLAFPPAPEGPAVIVMP